MCLILLRADIMNKEQRNIWDDIVASCHQSLKKLWDSDEENAIMAADVYIRKLERELQALKHKKAVAAILQKKV